MILVSICQEELTHKTVPVLLGLIVKNKGISLRKNGCFRSGTL